METTFCHYCDDDDADGRADGSENYPDRNILLVDHFHSVPH